MALPFAHLNLRRNPFGELPDDLVHAFVEGELPAVFPGDVLQVIAPQGHGKTTLLRALAAAHPGTVIARVDMETRVPSALPPPSALYLLDEADQLEAPALQALLRGAHAVVMATHEDLTPRAGRPVSTIALPEPSAERLARIAARRVEAVRRGPGDVPIPSPALIAAIFRRHGGNVRAACDELYDLYQQLREPRDARLQPLD